MSEIDVSKCPYLIEEHEWWDISGDKQITKNCCDIYLNDELNRFNYYEKCADNPNCYYKQLQQLKAENEELKKIRENLHKCNKKFMDEKHNISIKNIKYKQSLDEIEGIVKDICDEECDFKWCKGKKHCGDYDCRYMQIMEKIKQAKGNK